MTVLYLIFACVVFTVGVCCLLFFLYSILILLGG